MNRRHVSALAGLLSMGFSLSRESERLAALVRAVAMGERSRPRHMRRTGA